MNKKLVCLFAAACAVLFGAFKGLKAESSFPDLDVPQLLADSKDYRHRADVLRKMIGVRERKIGSIQNQANALVEQAQIDAQNRAAAAAAAQGNAANASAGLNWASSLLPGGGWVNNALKIGAKAAASSAVDAANAQAGDAAAQGAAGMGAAGHEADGLMAQAAAFAGEKKKLAYKASQYEQLADSKDLLAAAEILRLRAERMARSSDDAEKSVEAERKFVQGMSLW